jgi:hypothetical protein
MATSDSSRIAYLINPVTRYDSFFLMKKNGTSRRNRLTKPDDLALLQKSHRALVSDDISMNNQLSGSPGDAVAQSKWFQNTGAPRRRDISRKNSRMNILLANKNKSMTLGAICVGLMDLSQDCRFGICGKVCRAWLSHFRLEW